jgi:hypothetical protein
MSTETDRRTQLTRNGFALNAASAIELRRGEHLTLERHRHTHIACIRLTVDTKNASALISAVIAAVSDEPGEILVGTSKIDVLLLFKLGRTYNVEVRDGGSTEHQFVFRDAAGLFFATSDAEVGTFPRVSTAFDPTGYTWRDNLSPLNTRRDALAPLYPDVSKRAYDAVGAFLRENGGRWGPLVIPKLPWELKLEQSRAERAARTAAGIVEEEDTPESADEKLVAANPDLRQTDGAYAGLVVAARARIADRKATARAEAKRVEQEEKGAKARAKAMAEHLKQTA